MMTNNYSPKTLIALLPKQQTEIIIKLFGKKSITDVHIEKTLTKRISLLNGVFSRTLSYHEIVRKVSDHLKLSTSKTSIKIMEEEILKFQFKSTIDSLSKEDQQKFETELTDIAIRKGMDPNQIKSLGIVGSIAAANASGFGLYIMASTIVGGLSSALGIALPFAFYTSMSSVLSFLTGPVGWLIGIGLVGYSIRNENAESLKKKIAETVAASKSAIFSDYEFATVVISYLASCRLMLVNETEASVKATQVSIDEIEKISSELIDRNHFINNEMLKLKSELDKNLLAIASNKTDMQSKKEYLDNLRIKLDVIDSNLT